MNGVKVDDDDDEEEESGGRSGTREEDEEDERSARRAEVEARRPEEEMGRAETEAGVSILRKGPSAGEKKDQRPCGWEAFTQRALSGGLLHLRDCRISPLVSACKYVPCLDLSATVPPGSGSMVHSSQPLACVTRSTTLLSSSARRYVPAPEITFTAREFVKKPLASVSSHSCDRAG